MPDKIDKKRDTAAEEDKDSVLSCPHCDSLKIREDSRTGELVCRSCGTVLEQDRINENASRRAFTAEEKEKIERTGSPVTYTQPGKGMRTEIGGLKQASPEKRGKYSRMRKWQKRIDESKDRRLSPALREIQSLIADLGLPDPVKEEASRLYEKALEEDVVKGRRIEHIVSALVYIVARNHGVPRTLSEIAEKTDISERELGKNYRYIARELDLRIVPVNPVDFLPRYASLLELSGETQAKARSLITQAQEEGILAGRSPDSIVAAAIYLSSRIEGEELTQQEVAEKVGVTEVTVRKGFRNLEQGLGLEDID